MVRTFRKPRYTGLIITAYVNNKPIALKVGAFDASVFIPRGQSPDCPPGQYLCTLVYKGVTYFVTLTDDEVADVVKRRKVLSLSPTR